MPDVFTKAKRSEVMSRIRSRGNRETELALARLLRGNKIWGWRRQVALRVTRDKWQGTGKAPNTLKRELQPKPGQARVLAQIKIRQSKTRSPKVAGASSRRLLRPLRVLRVRPDFAFRRELVSPF